MALGLKKMFLSHPPMEQRIAALRAQDSGDGGRYV
jgi:Zn-dependent protease with chaperone function